MCSYINGFSVVFSVLVDIFGQMLNMCVSACTQNSRLRSQSRVLSICSACSHNSRLKTSISSSEYMLTPHKFNVRPNISTDTVYTMENPCIYKRMYPTTNQCSHTRTLMGHQDRRGATQNFREFARNNMNTYFKSYLPISPLK